MLTSKKQPHHAPPCPATHNSTENQKKNGVLPLYHPCIDESSILMSIGDFRIVGLPSFRCLSSARCRTESPSCWHRNAAAKAPARAAIFLSRFRVRAGGTIILVWVYCVVYFLLMCLLKWTPMDTVPSNQLSLPYCLSFESQCWQCWLAISPFAFVKHAKKKGLYPSTVYPIVRTVYMHNKTCAFTL